MIALFLSPYLWLLLLTKDCMALRDGNALHLTVFTSKLPKHPRFLKLMKRKATVSQLRKLSFMIKSIR